MGKKFFNRVRQVPQPKEGNTFGGKKEYRDHFYVSQKKLMEFTEENEAEKYREALNQLTDQLQYLEDQEEQERNQEESLKE